MTEELWTERVFRYFPIDRENIRQQILARISFLAVIWLVGLVAYSIDGLLMVYISNLQLVQTLFGTGFIVLLGSYMIQRSLPDVIASFRPLIQVNDLTFKNLSERLQRYSRSFLPILVITLTLTLALTDTAAEIMRIFTIDFAAHTVYSVCLMFFVYLLTGTGIWLGVSIWIAIFIISQQPLAVDLSTTTVEKFRDLNKIALWFSLFYVIAVSIGGSLSLLGHPALSLVDIIISPLSVFIVIGVVSILFPFFNIHRTLVTLKKQQLNQIDEEYQLLQQKLDLVADDSFVESDEHVMTVVARVLSLQIKEKSVRSAPEWPMDVGFLSKLITVVLIPSVVRITIEILNRTYFTP